MEKNQRIGEEEKLQEIAIFVDGVHEYNYTKKVEGNIIHHSLFYSKGQGWSADIRGELCLSLVDNGNGFVIEREIGRTIDYDEVYELGILLDLIDPKKGIDYYKKVEI